MRNMKIAAGQRAWQSCPSSSNAVTCLNISCSHLAETLHGFLLLTESAASEARVWPPNSLRAFTTTTYLMGAAADVSNITDWCWSEGNNNNNYSLLLQFRFLPSPYTRRLLMQHLHHVQLFFLLKLLADNDRNSTWQGSTKSLNTCAQEPA